MGSDSTSFGRAFEFSELCHQHCEQFWCTSVLSLLSCHRVCFKSRRGHSLVLVTAVWISHLCFSFSRRCVSGDAIAVLAQPVAHFLGSSGHPQPFFMCCRRPLM